MAELIAELRKLAEWPDDYGPASINDIAERAAAAIEAAREDGERLEWLERHCVNVADEYGTGSQLYLGTYATAPLRTAIDQARGKAGQEVGK